MYGLLPCWSGVSKIWLDDPEHWSSSPDASLQHLRVGPFCWLKWISPGTCTQGASTGTKGGTLVAASSGLVTRHAPRGKSEAK
eukprot:scaffold54898_cov63-Phaeocystis_antarctica.AAC.1